MITLFGLELLNPSGDVIADVSVFAQNRTWGETRNGADELSFVLPLGAFQNYCALQNAHPRTILRKHWTWGRIKRGSVYLATGRAVYLRTSLTNETVEVRFQGILDIFRKRRTAALREFTATEATTIAWTAIDESQQLTNGDLGITQGPNQATVGSHDRTYKRTVIKNLLQNLTTVQTSPFDFRFDPQDRSFNTYERLGSWRPDVVFKWGVNITDAVMTEDAVDLVNEVTGLGAGFSDADEAQAQVVESDFDSQAEVGLAQDVIVSNANDNADGGVTADAQAYKASWSRGVTLIDVVVDGGKQPYVTDYKLGDYVKIDLTGHPWMDGVVGMFRIESRRCSIGDDNTEPITLTVSV